MPKPIPEWVAPYVRQIADSLGLKDWEIRCRRGKLDPDTWAQIDFVEGRKVADVAFSGRFLREDPETQRLMVVHELIHCHVNSTYIHLEHLAGNRAISQTQYDLAHAQLRDHVELATDGISTAIACFFPLPPTEEPKENA